MDLSLLLRRDRFMPQTSDWSKQRLHFSAGGDLIQERELVILDDRLHLAGIQFDQTVTLSRAID